MNAKDKENLAYLYEIEQFKSFSKLCKQISDRALKELLKIDPTEPNAISRVAFIQGQAKSLEWLQLQIKKIHKDSMKES